MTADTTSPWAFDARIDLAGGGIDREQANRQMRTARAILKRLADRPGVVLADEVGMGKTFVALAVALSAAVAAKRPVVVMVPPRLFNKWERDIKRFRDRCMAGNPGEPETERLRFRRAETGVEFLRCFDDPEGTEAHVVLLVNTALHRSERDPFVRLAAVRQAVQGMWGARHLRHAVARFARNLLHSGALPNLIDKEIEALLDRPCDTWLQYLRSIAKKDESFRLKLDDDPVPAPFAEALENADLGELTECLRTIPRRESKNIEQRLAKARKKLNDVLHGLWRSVLKQSRISSPLLVFDEAHHLKNPDTHLASLFQEPESGDTSVFSEAFDRMVFLTATPFRLGHGELLEVLKRFLAVRWASMPPERQCSVVEDELSALGKALDQAQGEALHLERLWGELSHADIHAASPAAETRTWWARLLDEPPDGGILARILAHYGRTRDALNAAQRLLRPWVLRHLRPRQFVYDGHAVARRQEYSGRAIVDGISHHRGLEIEKRSRFPYLLCARAQSLLARVSQRRAYFAEGLASSFGAFLETSRGERPVDDPHVDLDDRRSDPELAWYLDRVESLVGSGAVPHPKIEATANKALALWGDGKKVLVFGHYRKTIRDLRERIREGVEREIARRATAALKLHPEAADEARDRVRRIAERLRDRESPLRRRVQETLERWVNEEAGLTESQKANVVDLLLDTLATPGFIVFNFPLDREEVRASLEAEKPTVVQARDAADAVADSLARRRRDRMAYRMRVNAFLRHLREDLSTGEERDEILTELREAGNDVVRHASGEVKEETRRRVLLGFNSPLLPEILVASEVMAEGLDLHLDCRHVIHHDLSWSPSTLEQRTGRIDRLRCLAEEEGESIEVYLPYLEGTADEKMYRVVTDRARWFQVVMGEEYCVDERATDRLEARVPFPEEAARGLTFDLSVEQPE